MSVEGWARKILEQHLGCVVELHDDGSRPSMYDLRAGTANSPNIAIECVGAVDEISIETWNVGPANGPIDVDTKGDWLVGIEVDAKIKELRKHLGAVLVDCEQRGLSGYLPVDWYLERHDPKLYASLTHLGLTYVHMFRANGTGKASLTMPGGGGVVNDSGEGIAEWVAYFLNHPKRSDVLRKLSNSGAKEKHVFIPITIDGAPWEVVSYFLSDMSGDLKDPNLPPPISAVWLTCNRKGLHWCNSEWRAFICSENQI